jgi:8-amino-7-oxononanoate synthase
MSDPLAWLDDALADLDRRALRRTLAARTGPQRADAIEIEGQTLVNFGSNDYLGLACDPRVLAAAREAQGEYGWGSGASPLVTGRSFLHYSLERELAHFVGTEAALLFPTGYAANFGAIAALVGKGDAIYSDARNHASVIDGCRLSGAAVHVYRHRDVEHLQELLAGSRQFGRRLIVTDTLFSMDGDFAPLPALAELAHEHGAMLLLDEAHATGVFGAQGRGLAEHFGVEAGVHVHVGTLSKALGSHGGFVAGSQRLVDWLANRARPYVFSTAAPAAVAAAGRQGIRSVRYDPDRRVRLGESAARLRNDLRRAGFDLGASESQIIPIILGNAPRALSAAATLRSLGMFVPAIRPPTVPVGQSLLRISVTYSHTDQHLDDLVAALRGVLA